MQQPSSEENVSYEPPTYDETFPVLPGSASSTNNTPDLSPNINSNMRVGVSYVTVFFRVPFEERKFDKPEFGEIESVRMCKMITKETGAQIEINSPKDQSITFVVSGKRQQVTEARRRILSAFQTQMSKQINIPKEQHRWILGKQGQKLHELQNSSSTKITVPNIQDTSDVVTITGTREGIEKAEHDIKVILEEQSRKAFVKISVPKIYHPFITGAYNENIQKIMAETGATIYVPLASMQNNEISIAGETEGVRAAKQKIEAIYRDMEEKCTTVSVEVLKQQHKYVIGSRGSTLAEILQLTGVSVEVPAADSPTGTITLRGPQKELGRALSKVYEKANSQKIVTMDAPSWTHRYIIGRKGANLKKLDDSNKVNFEFEDKGNKIKIEGPSEQVERVQKELKEIVDNYVTNYSCIELNVDPKHYKHIIGKSGSNINRMKEEYGVNIHISENSDIITIYGPVDGVKKAQQELLEKVEKMENEKEKDIIIEHKYHRNIIGNKREKLKEIKDMYKVQIVFPNPGEKSDVIKIRGVKQDVDQCYKHLLKFVKDLKETDQTFEVQVFKRFKKYLNEKGANTLRKLSDDTHTKIEVPSENESSETILIAGKREHADVVREKLLKMQNDLMTIVTEETTIPQKLFGLGRKTIASIMDDSGAVQIKFIPVENQNDKVTIKGPKEDVEKAKNQLLNVVSAEMRVKVQHHRFIIGKNGVNINRIRDLTGAHILFPSDKDEDKEIITIIGKKEDVEKAKIELEQNIRDINNIVEGEINIDPKYHRHFIARRGGILQKISEECGGVQISFPRLGTDSDRVVLKGSQECIESAKQKMRNVVEELESMVTIECIIPKKHHRIVMGLKRCNIQSISSEHDVQIKVPDRFTNDENKPIEPVNGENGEGPTDAVSPSDIIRITGLPKNVEAAKQALLDLVPIEVEVEVPFDFHRSIIGQKGKDVKELMDTYNVHIMVSPVQEKLDYIKITGSPANIEQAKQAILEKCKVLEAERQEKLLKSFELKIEVDPNYLPKIIGRQGLVVSKIRRDHDVQIVFPQKGESEENIITIIGYEKNTYEARDDIMKIVNELDSLTKEEVRINTAVHSRLIGLKGRKIREIMKNYKVDIKFPRKTDPDLELVTIIGAEENVIEAKEHILQLEEEFLQELEEMEYLNNFRVQKRDKTNPLAGNENDSGFVVKGAPWEQSQSHPNVAPNTASVEDFPQIVGSNHVPASAPDGAWGLKR